jgi:hypothetical protein
MSLYAITTELQSLIDLADRGGTDAEMDAAIAEHRQALVDAFDAKADDYAALVRTCEARADARRAEAKRMQLLADSDELLAERLRIALRDAMTATGRAKVETSRFRLAVRANGGKVPVLIDDEATLPPQFRVQVVVEKTDKDAIREALEGGKPVPGARLGERGTRLDIR